MYIMITLIRKKNKQPGVVIVIPDKVNFRAKNITKHKERSL